ncbi:hypothetical protein SRDD_07300 [Serratia sp. DD3]|nr:hypothetical protein SRDD_07300 [Serratia sp. DD3]
MGKTGHIEQGVAIHRQQLGLPQGITRPQQHGAAGRLSGAAVAIPAIGDGEWCCGRIQNDAASPSHQHRQVMIAARVGIGGHQQGIWHIFNQVELDQVKIEEQPVVCTPCIQQAVIIERLSDRYAVLDQIRRHWLVSHRHAIEVQRQVVDIGGIVGENQRGTGVIADLIEQRTPGVRGRLRPDDVNNPAIGGEYAGGQGALGVGGWNATVKLQGAAVEGQVADSLVAGGTGYPDGGGVVVFQHQRGSGERSGIAASQ